MLVSFQDKMKIQVKIKSNCKDSMRVYTTFLKSIFNKLNYDYSCVGLPTTFKTLTLLKSPHVNKTAKSQYEMRTYKQLFTIKSNIGVGCMNFLMLNKPKTVDIQFKTPV